MKNNHVLRRVPAYVHAPETLREIVSSLIEFDGKRREALFRQAHYLLNKPKHRIIKCLEYSEDPIKSWSVYQIALSDLLGFRLPLRHPSDLDMTIELFTTLRYYTFEVSIPKLMKFLNQENFISLLDSSQKKKTICEFSKKSILTIAKKVSTGITPRKQTNMICWKTERIDFWLEQAEKHFKETLNL